MRSQSLMHLELHPGNARVGSCWQLEALFILCSSFNRLVSSTSVLVFGKQCACVCYKIQMSPWGPDRSLAKGSHWNGRGPRVDWLLHGFIFQPFSSTLARFIIFYTLCILMHYVAVRACKLLHNTYVLRIYTSCVCISWFVLIYFRLFEASKAIGHKMRLGYQLVFLSVSHSRS